MTHKPLLQGGMEAPTPETHREREVRLQVERLLAKWGRYESVQRFIRKYGKPNTKAGYLADLDLYFRWLDSEGVKLTPDELIRDNLKCVFGSAPEEVQTKRKHTDWLDRYANRYLVEQLGAGEVTRHRKSAAIRQFYARNDAPMFGDFAVSEGKPEQQRRALSAEDIRQVLKALPINQRTPLVLMWQSGIEIGTILGLTWGRVNLESERMKLDFAGRKRHRRPYFTFGGRDSVLHLKIWRAKWAEDVGREPRAEDLIFLGKREVPMAPSWLNERFRLTALRLHKQGLVKNGSPGSWHVYALRHSFETEASHARVPSEIRDFLLGHLRGIQWVYNHRDQLYPEDVEREYAKMEPYVSLEPDKLTVRTEFEEREKSLLKRLEAAENLLEQLKQELSSSPAAPSQAARPGA
jgi:integrase